jgi:hypothetical protein
VSGDRLNWTIDGPKNTIDHYAILVQQGSQWTQATDLPAGVQSIPVTRLSLRSDTSALCVEAVGKASILNHFSGPIQYAPGKTSKP